MSASYVYTGVVGFFAGVALAFVGMPSAGVWLAVVLAGTLLVLYLLSPDAFIAVGAIFCICLAFGGLRAHFDINDSTQPLDQRVGERVQVQGVVTDRPAQTDYGQQFTVAITDLTKGRSLPDGQRVRAVVYGSAHPSLSYGDKITVSGRLQEPEAFAEDGRTFPYPQYLARNEIFYQFYQPRIQKLGGEGGSRIQRWLATLRAGLLNTLHKHIPDPHAALTGGVLLGAEEALGEKLQKQFRQTSLIHIVVLSGFNVTIVATVIGQGLLNLGLSLVAATAAGAFGIVLFALLVGMTPTVVRASIMAVFALLARVSGRSYTAGRGLSLAAVGMVAVNPHILLYDPSFQLSAVATAGLILLGDRIESMLTFVPETVSLREAATATISAQVAVLPLLLYYTGSLSLVSLPANLAVLPVVPVLMAAGTATIAIGAAWSGLAVVPAALSAALAGYIFAVVRTLAGLPAATVAVPPFSVGVVIAVYVVGGIAFARWVKT